MKTFVTQAKGIYYIDGKEILIISNTVLTTLSDILYSYSLLL